MPAGPGPHPLAILIHGGCWRADFAAAASIGARADALEAKGIASWSIEYRRVRQPGGGWPGTYLDVGRAVDYVRSLAGPCAPPSGRCWTGRRHRDPAVRRVMGPVVRRISAV